LSKNIPCGANLVMLGLPEPMFSKKLLILLVIAFLVACASTPKHTANNSIPVNLNGSLWEKAKNSYIQADTTPEKQKKAALAKEGLSYSEECLMKQPENAACYYYRAMNTGVYYSAHVKGYQSGIKTMIADCKKVIELDAKFDHAGAYRTLGKIYTDMPEIIITKNGVSRDLDLALKYLRMAVQQDPSYPENHIYLAYTLFEAGKKNDAFSELLYAEGLVPMWKNHPDYAYWQKLNKELNNKLK